MFKRILVYFQYIVPQHFLSTLIGWMAESRTTWLKNWLIKNFARLYKVNMQDAVITNMQDYLTFNDFFIRHLKPELRPITKEEKNIAAPIDGIVSQIGHIKKNQLLQAKNLYFDLETLLGNDTELAKVFYDGPFVTFYLGPPDYHRVHMPLSGKLKKTIYVPGRLFSVNRITSEVIPNLYGRNERLICTFDSDIGPFVLVFIGALIVGNIQTVWMNQPIRAKKIITQTFMDEIFLKKGAELGYFKLGSSVIILFEKNKIEWKPSIQNNVRVFFGQSIGKLLI